MQWYALHRGKYLPSLLLMLLPPPPSLLQPHLQFAQRRQRLPACFRPGTPCSAQGSEVSSAVIQASPHRGTAWSGGAAAAL